MIRKAIFWTHLVCGVATGLVVLMMSVTGVILTYERQMLAAQTRALHSSPAPGAERLTVDALVAAAQLADPEQRLSAVTVSANPRAPVVLAAGRAGSRYLDPYTGAELEAPSRALEDFFGAVTGWHRWFNADAESRATWRAITGISNLAFLFLIVSGVYLWLPRVFKWAMLRARLFFHANPTSQARDFNWHHVLGIWTAVPLFIVVATAVVFSYPWASNAVYRVFGEEPPAFRGPPPTGSAPGASGAPATGPSAAAGAQGSAGAAGPRPTLDALFERATAEVGSWQTITINLPPAGAGQISFSIDQGNGGQPQRRHTLVLDAASGAVASWQPFESQTPGRRARSWIRFLHTGEALGIAGQTVAGLVSLTTIVMVWTGLALAYRRLISPLFRTRARG